MEVVTNIKDRFRDSYNKVETTIAAKRKGDVYVWGIVILLIVASLLLAYSSTSALAYKQRTANFSFLLRQGGYVIVALGVMYLIPMVGYKYIGRNSVLLFMWGAIGLLVLTKVYGSSANSATRWVTIPFVSIKIQASDVAKLAIYMYVSYFLSRKQDVIKTLKTFIRIISLPAIACLLICLDNLSTGVLLFAIVLILCFIGRIRKRYLAIPVLLGFVLISFLGIVANKYYDIQKHKMTDLPAYLSVGRVPTWISRVQAFMYPTQDSDRDLQTNTAKVAIAEGGLFGKLPGNSAQKNFLPDCFSDFVFAIIIEEYGLIGAAFVMFLFMSLLYRCILIYRKCPYAFGAFLVLGLSFGLTIQALMNMAVAVNLTPVTGFTLPFISMGGTSLLLTCISIGLILSVSRNILDEKQNQELEASE